MKRIILTAVIALFVANSAMAVDSKGKVVVRTVGTHSCKKYVSAFKDEGIKISDNKTLIVSNGFTSYFGWIGGYMTRTNQMAFAKADVYKMNIVEATGWVAFWCKNNPRSTLFNAMTALTKSRTKKKQR